MAARLSLDERVFIESSLGAGRGVADVAQVWDGGNWSADWSDGSWDGYSYLDVSMPGVDYGMW